MAMARGAGERGQAELGAPNAANRTTTLQEDERPLVSILINNYNYERFLSAAIESALAQSYADCEVVVVDDGSSDRSREIIAAYAHRITPVLKANGGQPSALNAGIRHCRGEIVALLDADDVFHPDKVAELVAAARAVPDAAWIYHELDYIDEDGASIEPHGYLPERMVRRIRERAKRYAPHARLDLRGEYLGGKRPSYVCPALSALAIRRHACSHLFPVPEELGPAGDEFPKWMATALYPGVHLSRPLASQRLHRRNASTKLRFVDIEQITRYLKTAYYARERYPHLWRATDRWFAAWYGDLLGTDRRHVAGIPEARAYLEKYLGGKRGLAQAPRILAHAVRTAIGQTRRRTPRELP